MAGAPNGNGDGGEDDYPDEAEQIERALRWLGRQPRQSTEVSLAIIKRKLWEVGRDVLALRSRQDQLWNDYQQRTGRAQLVTLWLAILTVAIAALALILAATRAH